MKIFQLDASNPNIKIGDYEEESGLGISIIGYNAAGYDQLTQAHLLYRDQETNRLIHAGGYQAVANDLKAQYLLSGIPYQVDTTESAGTGYNYLFSQRLAQNYGEGQQSNFLLSDSNAQLQSPEGLNFFLMGGGYGEY